MRSFSIISPFFITKIKSAFSIVDNRWAITKLVRFSVTVSIAFWIWASVRVSTLEVASSRITTGGFAKMIRAMVNNCCCPCDNAPFSLEIIVSYPWGRVRIKWSHWAILAASIISSREASFFHRQYYLLRFLQIAKCFVKPCQINFLDFVEKVS